MKPQRSAKENMKMYRDNYAIRFHIPSINIIDVLIVPNNPTFQIQVVKYLLPVNLDQ